MRHSRQCPCWLTAIFGGLIIGTLGAQDPSEKKAIEPRVEPIIRQLLIAHNKERAKEGLPPFQLEGKLGEAARAHAADMAEREVMSHDGGDGSTPQQRVVRAGYHFLRAGENVARGYEGVPGVIQGWMESPPHRKNIMGEFTEVGIAVVNGPDGKPYWCVDFGKPMPKFDPLDAASSLIRRVNDERLKEKKTAVTSDPRLVKAAETIANELASKKGKLDKPLSFDSIDPKLFRDLAMNTSAGRPDAESLVQGLLENEDQKTQLLGKYTRIGVGYAVAEDGNPYWCLILGLPSGR